MDPSVELQQTLRQNQELRQCLQQREARLAELRAALSRYERFLASDPTFKPIQPQTDIVAGWTPTHEQTLQQYIQQCDGDLSQVAVNLGLAQLVEDLENQKTQ